MVVVVRGYEKEAEEGVWSTAVGGAVVVVAVALVVIGVMRLGSMGLNIPASKTRGGAYSTKDHLRKEQPPTMGPSHSSTQRDSLSTKDKLVGTKAESFHCIMWKLL